MAKGDVFQSIRGKSARQHDSLIGPCSSCGARINLGLPTCPVCSEATATASDRPNRARIVDPSGDDALTRCPSCAANIAADDAYCRSCGYDLTNHARTLPSASPAPPARVLPLRRFVFGGAALVATGAALLGVSLTMLAWLDAAPAASRQVSVARPVVRLIATLTPAAIVIPPTATTPPTAAAPTTPPLPTIAVIDAPSAPSADASTPSVGAPLAAATETPIAVPRPAAAVPGVVRANQEKVVVRPAPALGEQLTFVVNGASVGVLCVVQGGAVPGQTSSDWYRVQTADGAVGYIFATIIDVSGAQVPLC
jgi:hypothetical protein